MAEISRRCASPVMLVILSSDAVQTPAVCLSVISGGSYEPTQHVIVAMLLRSPSTLSQGGLLLTLSYFSLWVIRLAWKQIVEVRTCISRAVAAATRLVGGLHYTRLYGSAPLPIPWPLRRACSISSGDCWSAPSSPAKTKLTSAPWADCTSSMPVE